MKCCKFLFVIVFVVATSCTGNGVSHKVSTGNDGSQQDNYVRSIRLKSPLRNDVYSLGQGIPVIVDLRRKKYSIDSIQFIENGNLLHTIKKKPWLYTWKPTGKNLGKHSLKVVAYHPHDKIGQLTSVIQLKSNTAPKKYVAHVVSTFPHDRAAYTQGLLYHNGYLWEGTGQRGESSLRKVNIQTGEVLANTNLDSQYFGEGITLYKERLVQLTWTSGKAFVFNDEDLSCQDTFYLKSSNGQGWGITTLNNELVISDGSNLLTVLDPVSFEPRRTIEVYDHRGAVEKLNELEYINGLIYANVWMTDRIVMIDPATGRVAGDIDLSGLLTPAERARLTDGDDVLNGIAWDGEKKRLFVTGKRWPKLFEIRLDEK